MKGANKMGLDMYLYKKVYVGANYEHNQISGTLALKRREEPIEIDLQKVIYITESVAYWRKANQIHYWFVKNVQYGEDDCKPYIVYGEKLLELVELCKKVLKNQHLLFVHLNTQFHIHHYENY